VGAELCADTFIQKTKKLYLDSRTQRNLTKLQTDVQEVTSIMTKNIQEILGQGEKMTGMIGKLLMGH
jgi:vesicle transport protein SEC22